MSIKGVKNSGVKELTVPSCQLKVSKEESTVVGSLSSQSEIVIKPPDKSEGFVIMSESKYAGQVSKLLESRLDYEKVNTTAVTLDETTRQFVRDQKDHS